MLEQLKAPGCHRRLLMSRTPRPWPSTSLPFPPHSRRLRPSVSTPANAFGFWNWVGGRYSVDSAVGLSLVIVVFGPERFQQFLEGFHAIDEYFCNTPLESNAVALMGLLNVWYVNFFRFQEPCRASVLPVSAPLPGLPAAAHHGVQRQARPLGRQRCDLRYR